MKYFAVFLPMKDQELSQQYRPQHLAYLEELDKQNKIFARGRFVDGAGGLVIYMTETFEETEQLVTGDPYVSSGARDYEIHEWEMIR
jgi:uncharacterized protein YciI